MGYLDSEGHKGQIRQGIQQAHPDWSTEQIERALYQQLESNRERHLNPEGDPDRDRRGGSPTIRFNY